MSMSRMKLRSRPVPEWMADVYEAMSRDQPDVVTLERVRGYVAEVGSDYGPDEVLAGLERLGWLDRLPITGGWTFIPAGSVAEASDYTCLRAWRTLVPETVVALAGEVAAGHLGYLPRRFMGTTAVWLPPGECVHSELQHRLSRVELGGVDYQIEDLVPSMEFLRRRKLDMSLRTRGLPVLGPEALVVQLSSEPRSFRVWSDLAGQLDRLVCDCDVDRLEQLLEGHPTETKQRAAYLLHRGGRTTEAEELVDRSTTKPLPVVDFGADFDTGFDPVFDPRFNVRDSLVAHCQEAEWKG